jgi:hypothetical protein
MHDKVIRLQDLLCNGIFYIFYAVADCFAFFHVGQKRFVKIDKSSDFYIEKLVRVKIQAWFDRKAFSPFGVGR